MKLYILLKLLGNESASPYNPYRLYTIDELSTEAGSTLNANVDFNGTEPENLILVNGRLVPTVNMVNKNPYIFKIVNAGTGGSLHITLPTTATSCSGTVIAVDGVYLQARWERTSVHLPPGSRVDLELFCDFTGNVQCHVNVYLMYICCVICMWCGSV
jgi:FtsP/CotA-like multicopper oxidase with cupredoxin domain